MTDIKQDASPAMQDEMFEKDDLTYTVEWNEYLLTHEANIYKQKLDNYGRINMNHISYGVGLSKDKAIADAESKIDAWFVNLLPYNKILWLQVVWFF